MITAVVRLEYCRFGVKHKTINLLLLYPLPGTAIPCSVVYYSVLNCIKISRHIDFEKYLIIRKKVRFQRWKQDNTKSKFLIMWLKLYLKMSISFNETNDSESIIKASKDKQKRMTKYMHINWIILLFQRFEVKHILNKMYKQKHNLTKLVQYNFKVKDIAQDIV